MKLMNNYGQEIDVELKLSKYCDNGNMAVLIEQVTDIGNLPYSVLTVNLGFELDEGQAYIDTNNNGDWIVGWLIANGLGTVIGSNRSGFCEYPLFQFYMDKLNEVIEAQEVNVDEKVYS